MLQYCDLNVVQLFGHTMWTSGGISLNIYFIKTCSPFMMLFIFSNNSDLLSLKIDSEMFHQLFC